jgi:antitoxin (DNA-binding transcriptional repressor) of toxin-antitoxin stability system
MASNRVSASDLARRLGDILGRVRYRGESFVVERHHIAIARITPAGAPRTASLRDAAARWLEAGKTDPDFAADLEQVRAADRAPGNPWDS